MAQKVAKSIWRAFAGSRIICSRTQNIMTTARIRRHSSADDPTLVEAERLMKPHASRNNRARRNGEPGSDPVRRYWAISQSMAATRNTTASRLDGSSALVAPLVWVLPAARPDKRAKSRLLRNTSITIT